MSYIVNKTDGTIVATVEDGTLNTDTSLILIGRNYQGYGDVVAENFIQLLENSANPSAPTKPMTGELWFDTSNNALKVYDGSYFQYINSVRPSATTPTQSLRTGVLWYDTSNALLKLYTGSTFVTVGPTIILDEDDLASNSDTAVPSQQSVKAYVDDVVISSNTLPVSDDASNSIQVTFIDGVYFKGGNSITTSVNFDSTAGVEGEARVLIELDNTITVNTISSSDSTAVVINDNLNVDGSLDVGSNFTISNGTSINAILDQDNMSSNSATALATQQSIKAYVDTQLSAVSTTLGISDTASNSTTITVGTDDLEFRSGDSITPTVAGSGVTFNLNDDITVNKVSAKDSSTVEIASPILLTSDSGITIGADGDVLLSQSGANFTLKNETEDGNILINVNDGGSDTNAITVTGSDASVTIANNLTVTGNLTVNGTTTTVSTTNTTIEDPLIVLNQGQTITSGYDGGIIINRGIGDSSNQRNAAMLWDESANEFAFIYTTETGSTAGNVSISQYADLQVSNLTGQAASALYADLAERYEADSRMDIGDVVKIGGEKEITKTTCEYDTDVFGVIAENPAFKMNSGAGEDSTHPYVTLTGRTVCKVQGPIAKGDRICASDVPGVAKKCDINNEKFHILSIIGRSLGQHSTTDVAMIEVVLGRN